MAQQQLIIPANFPTDETGRPNRPIPVIQVGSDGSDVAPGSASGTAAVTGTFNATGNSGLFTAKAGRAVWVKLTGTFVATVQVQRCSDGTTATANPLTVGGTAYAVFTAPAQEAVSSEDDTGVAYRLSCTVYTSGTVTYSIGHK
jgi:hypothetical protein